MTRETPALGIAIHLLNTPSRVWSVRSSPLPDGVVVLLQIAVGDAEALDDAVKMTGRSVDVIQRAAEFFIEQILFYSETDSYRVLGVNPQATSSELRHNMALLLRWLHPDIGREGMRSLFSTNVTNAWNDLKTDDRRASYDSTHPATKPRRGRSSIGSFAKGQSARASRPRNKVWAINMRQDIFEARGERSLKLRLWQFLFGRPGL